MTWELAGKPLRSDDQISIENPDYLSKFVIAKAQRKHTGKYTITAKNSSGTDSAEVDILVLGKPSKPQVESRKWNIFNEISGKSRK